MIRQPSSALVVTSREGLRRVLAARRRPRRIAKPRELRAPRSTEREYARELQRILLGLATIVRVRLLPLLPEIVQDRRRFDDARFDARTLRYTLDELEVGYAAEFEPKARAAARRTGAAIAVQNKTQVQQLSERLLGIRMETAEPWLTDELSDFITYTSRLVKRVSTDFFDRLEARIENGVRGGLTITQLTDQIEADFATAEGVEGDRVRKRARLIARDQVGSYFGELTRKRQGALGVKRYTWSTSHDERVRSSHRERDGQIFEWGRSIEDQLQERGFTVDQIDGHPGRPIQCRCVALPVIEDLFVGDDDDPEPPPPSRSRSDSGAALKSARTNEVEQPDLGVTFERAPRARRERERVVVADLESLIASLSRNRTSFVGLGGRGEIAGRIEGATEFINRARNSGQRVHMPQLGLTSIGEATVRDGRHRLEALRRLGVREVPVSVDAAQAKDFAERFGTKRR